MREKKSQKHRNLVIMQEDSFVVTNICYSNDATEVYTKKIISEFIDLRSSKERWPWCIGGARGKMFIIVGNGLGDTSSNPGRLHFT